MTNQLLKTSCILPVKGRGVVQEIPLDVLFFRRFENTPQRLRNVTIWRLYEHSITRIARDDLVVFEGDSDRVYQVDSVEEEDIDDQHDGSDDGNRNVSGAENGGRMSLVLSAFDPSHRDIVICDFQMAQMLRLVGALRCRRDTETAAGASLAKVKQEELFEEDESVLPTQLVEYRLRSTSSSDEDDKHSIFDGREEDGDDNLDAGAENYAPSSLSSGRSLTQRKRIEDDRDTVTQPSGAAGTGYCLRPRRKKSKS